MISGSNEDARGHTCRQRCMVSTLSSSCGVCLCIGGHSNAVCWCKMGQQMCSHTTRQTASLPVMSSSSSTHTRSCEFCERFTAHDMLLWCWQVRCFEQSITNPITKIHSSPAHQVSLLLLISYTQFTPTFTGEPLLLHHTSCTRQTA